MKTTKNLIPATLHGFAFPNPVKDMLSVSFDNLVSQRLRFEIYDESYRLVHLLLNDEIKTGANTFSFSTAPLPQGVYFLRISSDNKIILFQKIAKAK